MKITRINNNYNMEITGELREVWPGFNDDDMVEDDYMLEDSHEIHDNEGIEEFLSFLFGIDYSWFDVDRFWIDERGEIVTTQLEENNDKFTIDSDKKLSINEINEGVDLSG